MVELVPFLVEHYQALAGRPAAMYLNRYMTEAQLAWLEVSGSAYTVKSGERVLVVGGVAEYWPNRGEAWAIFGETRPEEFMGIHSVVKKFLDQHPTRRIEAAVDVDFEQGHRWVKSLGFQLEAPRLKAYRLDGGDSALYARVREQS